MVRTAEVMEGPHHQSVSRQAPNGAHSEGNSVQSKYFVVKRHIDNEMLNKYQALFGVILNTERKYFRYLVRTETR